MIKEAIAVIVSGKSLTLGEASSVMEEIMGGQATPAQIGAFLMGLRIKGETAEEIAGLATVMRARATQVTIDGPVLDIVGTGGDGTNTFNISTTAAFVVAGAGLKVAKHGNRSASSRCGSADVLEALGVKIELSAAGVKQCVEQIGIGFMFAPVFHPAMKYVAAARKEIGVRTVFNILGPLTNPAGARYNVIGVPGVELGDKVVSAFSQMDIKHALVVHGLNGMDELSTTGESIIWEVIENKITGFRRQISPEELGIKRTSLSCLQGGSAKDNAGILRSVLAGEITPCRDIVLLNAAAALMAGDKVSTLLEGLSAASVAVDSGRAMAKLEELIKLSQGIGGKTS
jgi:anthranilate phosphoribosyltransferase